MHQYHTSALSNEVYNFVFTQRAQKLSAIKFQMHSFHSKTDFTFLLQLITFKPLDLKQSYIPHLKVLMCGINDFGAQWCGHISISCYTHLKLELLLHKIVLIMFLLASTVGDLELKILLTQTIFVLNVVKKRQISKSAQKKTNNVLTYSYSSQLLW